MRRPGTPLQRSRIAARGFNEREVTNDRGYRVSLEVHSTDIGTALKWEDSRLRALAFFDAGAARRNKALPDELTLRLRLWETPRNYVDYEGP